MNAVVVKLENCGFCGASGDNSCREFLQDVPDHSERSMELPELFIYELDGLTAETAEQAYEWEQERQQYEQEAYAESGWLRAAENNPVYAWESEQDELRAAGLYF
ncbi:hypothetical protein ACFZAM_31845 [Streptomyces sp. NPDC008079]|uniref:hypothetical protein n=1 Tax=Streptomyces sp. NPDC008079 TaxID=3364806 RepID=UPI0036E6796B